MPVVWFSSDKLTDLYDGEVAVEMLEACRNDLEPEMHGSH